MIYNNLTPDEITQLEFQAGKKATEILDELRGKSVDPDLIESAVNDWLGDHPEATTTVQDGSITKAKLATPLQNTVDAIPAVDATLATAGAAADAKATGDAFAGKAGITMLPLERGNIAMSASGWSYTSSTTRVRIKQGTTVHLNAGDVIGLTTYTGYRMYVGWLPDGEETYGLKGWLTDDFVAFESGEYTVLLSKSPEATATVDDFKPLFFVKPVGTINYKVDSIGTMIDNGYNLLNLAHVDDGYFETNGVITIGNYGEKHGSDFIKVKPGEQYRFICTASVTGAGFMRVICYDGANGVVGNISEVKTAFVFDYYEYGRGFCIFDFTIPEGTYKIRVSWRAYGDCWGFLMRLPAAFANDVENLRREQGNLATFVGNSLVKGISHSGYTMTAPENTLPAFQEARRHGFRYVECDLQFTSDGVPVLLHDNTINRTARNADGTELSETINIADIAYEDALEYDFGIYKDAAYAGTKIPTLAEFLALCRLLGLIPYIELKSTATEQNVSSAITIAKKYGILQNITWLSFSATILGYVQSAAPAARLGLTSSTLTTDTIDAIQDLQTGANEVIASISYTALTDEKVQLCVDEDIPLVIWTLNDADAFSTLNPYVSGIISDRFNADGILYGLGMQ